MNPINYTSMQVNPAEAITQGLQMGLTIDSIAQQKQQQAAAAQAQEAAIAGQRALQSVLSNPNATVQDYGAVAAINPKFRETVKDHWDRLDTSRQQSTLGDAAKLFGALQSGRNDIALATVADQLAAAENSGDTQRINNIKMYRDMIEKAPDYARTMIGASMAAIPDGDKYFTNIKTMGEEGRAAEQAPAALAIKESESTIKAVEAENAGIKATADLQKTGADIANVRSQIAERSNRLGLDRDKFNLEFDTALEKLRGSQGAPELSAGMEKTQAEAVGNALVSRTASDRAIGLAEALRAEQTSVGGRPLRWMAENAKRITGSEDGYTALRQDYVRIRNQGLLSDLPPGPASDKDIGLMKDGFPGENQSPEYIANWLESFAKVQKAIAQKEDAKGEWISAVGSLRTAPKDITIGNTTVPAGTSFTEFIGRTQKADAPKVKNKTGYMDFGK